MSDPAQKITESELAYLKHLSDQIDALISARGHYRSFLDRRYNLLGAGVAPDGTIVRKPKEETSVPARKVESVEQVGGSSVGSSGPG